jgi:hypothetical protein
MIYSRCERALVAVDQENVAREEVYILVCTEYRGEKIFISSDGRRK